MRRFLVVNKGGIVNEVKPAKLLIRKLTKSGSSRYLSVGTILPEGWEAVKVFVIEQTEDVCVLRLELIK